MAYTKTNWTNGAGPKLNETNLNKIEQGIKDATDIAEAALPASYLDTNTALTANSDTKVPSQKAVKAYVTNAVSGVGGGSGANLTSSRDASTVSIFSDTGTDVTIAAADNSNAGVMTAAQQTKLAGIATAATANSSDATLLNRSNHTGTQTAATISDFAETTDDRVNALLVAGTGIAKSYNDAANSLTLTTDPDVVRSPGQDDFTIWPTASDPADDGATGVYAWLNPDEIDGINRNGNDSATRIEVMSRTDASGSTTPTSGDEYLSYYTPDDNYTLDGVGVFSGGSTAATGTTYCAMGLFTVDPATDDVTLVARTASDTTILSATNTSYERAFATAGGYPATYDVERGVRYAYGFLITGNTNGQFKTAGNAMFYVLSPRMNGRKTGRTALESSTAASFTNTATMVALWGTVA